MTSGTFFFFFFNFGVYFVSILINRAFECITPSNRIKQPRHKGGLCPFLCSELLWEASTIHCKLISKFKMFVNSSPHLLIAFKTFPNEIKDNVRSTKMALSDAGMLGHVIRNQIHGGLEEKDEMTCVMPQMISLKGNQLMCPSVRMSQVWGSCLVLLTCWCRSRIILI